MPPSLDATADHPDDDRPGLDQLGPDQPGRDQPGPGDGRTTSGLDVLVLGGTSWLGGAVARLATARGHRVTCLARGEAGSPPSGVTWVRADRGTPDAYDDVTRPWDLVVDVSWQPELVRSALDHLAGGARHWAYVSSGSVYADDSVVGEDEGARLLEPWTDPGPVDAEAYGPAKVACEQLALDALGPDRLLVARAGLIGGYGDLSDRLGYWPARVDRAEDGEPVLVPPREDAVQVIDVLDLATWLVDGGERRTAGAFNLVGATCTVGDVLDATVQATGRRPRLVEVDHAWLGDHGVAPWAGPGSLPLWLPQPGYAGFMTRTSAAARSVGLTTRPLLDTVRDALRWEREQGTGRKRRAGLFPARERELLAEAGVG